MRISRKALKARPQTKKMKKIEIVFVIVFLFFFACTSTTYWKLRIEVPGKSDVRLDEFKEIVVTDFLIKKQTKDIDLNKEIIDYLTSEIGKNFNGKVSPAKISVENENVFGHKEFWKNFWPGTEGIVVLTGSAQFTEEIRKAILEKRKQRFEDPFPAEKALEERRFYNLNLNLYLIDPKTGKALYQREFKESRGYDNPKQTAFFAFFDLIQAVKGKLFSQILGERKIQERYLISR